jgi:hypothetical protein
MISADKDTNKREQNKEKKHFSLVLSSGSIFGEAKGNRKSHTLVRFSHLFRGIWSKEVPGFVEIQ